MSEMPFYFSIASLAVLLIYREIHHSRIERGLIDKILEQKGLDAIPQSHPLAEVITKMEHKANDEPAPVRVRIPIPGMAAFTREYNRVMKVREGNK